MLNFHSSTQLKSVEQRTFWRALAKCEIDDDVAKGCNL